MQKEDFKLMKVLVTKDCFSSCLAHALTTSNEEIMGLLLGNLDEVNKVCTVWDICPLRRLDKRRDRVEISAEQLVNASNMAEKATIDDSINTRVIGWYHSHPEFICFPSTIDLNCQYQYQQLDKGFIGLIVSLFNYDKRNVGSIKLHAFQSSQVETSLLNQQHLMALSEHSSIDISSLKFEDDSQTTLVSTPIPVEIIDNGNYPKHSLERMIRLQELIIEEEQNEYHQALEEDNSSLSHLHNSGVYQANLVQLIDSCINPLKEQYLNELERKNKK